MGKHDVSAHTHTLLGHIRGLSTVCDPNAKICLRWPGLVFMKGLRLIQVLGLSVGSDLRLLSQLSFVLNPYSQKVT